MPFTMIHLYIGYNILISTPQIKNPCDFILGTIAPDSVHFRDNYNSDMKKKSHLCVGDEQWGKITNNQEWLLNVLTFLKKTEYAEVKDFIYGYCCHIITDIQNNLKVWMPFRAENADAVEKGMGSIYHQESFSMDYELYLSNPKQKIIWGILEEAAGYDLENIIGSDEINKMKHHTLKYRFMNRKSVDVSLNKYVTLEGTQDFISDESKYIKKILFGDV